MDRIVIYGTENCVFCNKAKNICTDYMLTFNYIDINKEDLSKETLSKMFGCKISTVPQITVNEEHIGGYSELKQFLDFYY
jgi:glutaredoxin